MEGKLKRLGLTVLVMSFLSSLAFADHHYGMAGCGIGAMVYKDQPGKIQIVAATLNNIIVPQTSAITTGSSNCHEERRDTAALYIQINKVALQKEIAQGTGETLAGLNEIYGCEDLNEFSSTLKTNFVEIYPTQEVEAKDANENIMKLIEKNSNLKSCKIFS